MQHLDEGTIHAWLDGALSAGEGARIEAHLAECPACSAAVAEARGLIAGASRILSALDDVPGGVIPEPAFTPAPQGAAARAGDVTDIAARRGRWLRAPYLSAAAAVLLVAMGTLVVGRQRLAPPERAAVTQAVYERPAHAAPVASADRPAPAPAAVAGERERVADVPAPVSPAPAAEGRTSRARAPMAQRATAPQLADAAPSARRNEAPEREMAKVSAAYADSPSAPPGGPALRRPQALQSQARERPTEAEAVASRAAADAPAAGVAGAAAPRADSGRTGTLVGVVRNKATGHPVEGAQVYLPGQGAGSLTDAAGRYSIKDIPVGSHAVAARRIGYESARRDVQVVAGGVQEVDFSVSTSTTQLSEVAVTGTRERPARRAVSSATSVVTADSAQRAKQAEAERVEQGQRRVRAEQEQRAGVAAAAPRPTPPGAAADLARAPAPSLAGCYELSLERWQPAVSLGADSIVLRPPRRIVLEAAALDERTLSQSRDMPRAYQVRPAPGAPSAHETAYWIPVGADSVEIVWESGFSGLVMRLAARGETLQGRAETFSDAGRPRQTSGVTARRMRCEAAR